MSSAGGRFTASVAGGSSFFVPGSFTASRSMFSQSMSSSDSSGVVSAAVDGASTCCALSASAAFWASLCTRNHLILVWSFGVTSELLQIASSAKATAVPLWHL